MKLWPFSAILDLRRLAERAQQECERAQVVSRLLRDHADGLAADLRANRQALERVIDNALFAAGAAPVFAPEDKRFQPRDLSAQKAEAAQALHPLSPEEWRRQLEASDAEQAERDRKARLVEQLEREAALRKSEEAKHAD